MEFNVAEGNESNAFSFRLNAMNIIVERAKDIMNVEYNGTDCLLNKYLSIQIIITNTSTYIRLKSH